MMLSGHSLRNNSIQEVRTINPRHDRGHHDRDNIRINHRIRAREVRVIGPDGTQLGVMDTRSAIQMAESHGLDLAEVSPTANPPVCKILDYGKYKYELKKKQKVAKKNQVVILVKEVQFRPQTDTHDIDFKVKHIQRFLEEGNKVKVSVRFRGREASHQELGHSLLKQIIDMVGILGIVEANPKLEGKVLHLLFGPNPKAKKAGKPASEASSTTSTESPKAAPKGSSNANGPSGVGSPAGNS